MFQASKKINRWKVKRPANTCMCAYEHPNLCTQKHTTNTQCGYLPVLTYGSLSSVPSFGSRIRKHSLNIDSKNALSSRLPISLFTLHTRLVCQEREEFYSPGLCAGRQQRPWSCLVSHYRHGEMKARVVKTSTEDWREMEGRTHQKRKIIKEKKPVVRWG